LSHPIPIYGDKLCIAIADKATSLVSLTELNETPPLEKCRRQ